MEINSNSPQEMKVNFLTKNHLNFNPCKECKGFSKSILLHGEKKFQEFPYIPYKLDFLRVNSVEYGYDLGSFFEKKGIHTPPHIKICNEIVKVPQEMKVSQNPLKSKEANNEN